MTNITPRRPGAAVSYPFVAVPTTLITRTVRSEAHAAAAAAGAQLQYNNGPLIQNVKLHALYWGSVWSTDAAQGVIASRLNAFMTSFVSGPDIDRIAEYSIGHYAIGRGTFVAPGLLVNNDPPNSVSDAQIQAALQEWIQTFRLDVTADSLFMVFTPPGVEVVASWGGRSCGNSTGDFAGYHADIGGQVFYGVIPQCISTQQTTGLNATDALRIVLSHEICEAVTDPIFKQGWWDPDLDEVGDPCQWMHTTGSDGGVIQGLWSNARGTCA
jgi:hypothetical protein